MRNYIDIIESNMLMELFRDPFEWKWNKTSKKQLDATFKTDKGYEGYIVFDKIPLEEPIGKTDWVWSIDFFIDDELGITGDGEAYKIFATVVDIIKDVIKSSAKPPILAFDAMNFGGVHNDSRTKLYSAMLKKLSSSVGYDFKVRVNQKMTYFLLIPK